MSILPRPVSTRTMTIAPFRAIGVCPKPETKAERPICKSIANMYILLVLALIAQVTVLPRTTKAPTKDYPIRAVPLTSVRITDAFWAPKREINRTVTIPHIMQENELTGRVDNFLKAAKKKTGPYQGQRYNDTDVYKIIEAASSS